jgi:hypothetical protein
MNSLTKLVLAGPAVLIATSASANPVMSELARIREVPGPHVQLTYAVDGSSGKSPKIPSAAETFGTKSTPWKAASYSANTGSGIRGLLAVQRCDCFVPMGQSLVYNIVVSSEYDGKNITYKLGVTTTGTYDAGTPKPLPEGDAGHPWDIPDPVEIQGIDCTVECAATEVPLDGGAVDVGAVDVGGLDAADAPIPGMGGAIGSGGVVGSGGAAGTGGAVGSGGAIGSGGNTAPATTAPKSDGGGSCSIAHGNRSPGLFAFALGLGLALLGRRKRRG